VGTFHGHGQFRTAGDEHRPDAILALPGAGLLQRPSRAQAVDALAAARREVAACRESRAPIWQWLADEVRLRGIRENAAVLAVLEIPDLREDAALAFAREHPDRLPALQSMLTVLT
jgi:hypothetical protein